MAEAPQFWWKERDLRSRLMFPLGWIYGKVAGFRMSRAPNFQSPVPVLCIGNFVAGGAGKTPTAIRLAKAARDAGRKPGFLSRGYGGSVTKPTLVDPAKHHAGNVGDEPILLANVAPTVVSANRPKGAVLLAQQDVDFIIMDDGFQNPALYKDFSLVVVDARRGMGNGFNIPAGPLRASLSAQIPMADEVLLIGADEGANPLMRKVGRGAKPTHQAHLKPIKTKGLAKKKILAFSGIGDPEKFFQTLDEMGANIVEKRSFGDHHPFNAEEMADLIEATDKNKLTLVTTTKDKARLEGIGVKAKLLLEKIKVVEVELVFENTKTSDQIIAKTLKAFEKRKSLK